MSDRCVVALCGGIGGAKLALGLSCALPADRLTIIVNTGDDFEHFGLSICPDIDTVTYTLAGRVNPETGWGRSGESWRFMEGVRELGGEDWFNLGDTDLATHAVRTAALRAGVRLTEVSAGIANALGVKVTILPATDDPVRTIVDTNEGVLSFQRYFVGRRCEPVVRGLHYKGAAEARPSPEVVASLGDSRVQAIILCPSNPYLSIDPMLSIPDMRALLRRSGAPIIAVTPIVKGTAIKGPLAKMMKELGHSVEPQTIVDHYGDLIDLFIGDKVDRDQPIEGTRVHYARTVMRTLDDRVSLARTVLDCASAMPRRGAVGDA